MAALVVPGAPVSALLEYGLTEEILEKLSEAGIATVEKLGYMTPEDLEAIPGIGAKMVERIQSAVVGYYGQFEGSVDSPPAAAAVEAPVEVLAEPPAEPEASEPPADAEVAGADEPATDALPPEGDLEQPRESPSGI